MALEAWVSHAAEEMWGRLGDEPRFPRDPERLAVLGFEAAPVRLAGLRVSVVSEWLRRRRQPPLPREPDRPLHGCLVAGAESCLIFLEAQDSEAEQRYTMAHELAHLWLEVLGPRQRALRIPGPAAARLMDGAGYAGLSERLYAAVHGLRLRRASHLLRRDGPLGLMNGAVFLAEERADRLALELLAPEAEALRVLPPPASFTPWLEHAAERLERAFGLPGSLARGYGRRLAPCAGVYPSFWDLPRSARSPRAAGPS